MTIGKISDNQLIKSVTQKIMQKSAGSGCRVNVAVSNGYVTLSGTIENEYQRRPFTNAASGISGVRRVIDQTQVVVKKKRV
jgi:osmotically-inducible protein OsmY